MAKRKTITIEKNGLRVGISSNHQTRNGQTYKSFLIRATIHGQRHVKSAPSLEEARKIASEMIAQVRSGGGVVATYTPKETAIIENALAMASKAKVSLTDAVSRYAEAVQHLPKGVSLVEAVRGYAAKLAKEDFQPVSVEDLVQEYLKALEGRSESHRKTIALRLRKATDRFRCNIGDITSKDVDSWLRSMKVGPLTRNHHRTALISLFRYAQRKDYLPIGLSAAEKSETAREKPRSIEWYSPKQATHLINAIDPLWRPYVAIGLFAGIRPQETFRLDWSDIKADHIEVRASGSKVGVRRIVPLVPNLSQWLASYRQKSGPVCPVFKGGDLSRAQSVSKALRAAAEQGGFKVIYDGLRHSFITFRVADIQNLPQVALEAGNSPAIIQEHYNGRSTPAEAKKYFGITPEKQTGKIINFAA